MSYLFCLVLVLLVTWRIVCLGGQPFLGDIRAQFLPWKAFAREALAEGRIPLWNPYTYGGGPFLANLQSAVFYPIDLFLSCFPIQYHFGWSLVFHMLLSMWLMLLLGSSCGLSRWGSCLAAVTYGLNGFVMIHIPFGNHLTYTSIAWAPGLIWVGWRAIQAPRLRLADCALFALLITLQLLCGHPQMAFYAFFFTGIFILTAGAARGGKAVQRGLLAFGLGGLVAAGLTAFQLLPTLEYIPLSGRQSAISFTQATEFSFAPHRLISLVAGEYFGSHMWGNHWDVFYYWSSAYGGAILPILAGIGAVAWRSNRSLRLGVFSMAILALVLACGRENPLYQYVLMLPGFKHFRAPAKFLPWFILAVSLLGGRGLDWLVQHIRSLPKEDRLRHSPFLPPIAALGGLIGVLMVAPFLKYQASKDPNVIRAAAGFVAMGYMALAASWYVVARRFPWARGAALPAGLLLLILVDLWGFGHKYIQPASVPPDTVWRWLGAPPEADLLRRFERTQGPFRIAVVGDFAYPNATIPWHLRGLSGYDPMSLRTTMDLLAASEAWPPDKFVDSVELKQNDSPVYDLFDVHYLLTPDELSGSNFELVTRGRYLRVYRRKAAPRAVRWVSESKVTYRPPSGPARTAEDLLRLSWDEIEIDGEPLQPPYPQPAADQESEGNAEVLFWDEEEISVRYEASEVGWLVLSLPWYPGWKAILDGGESRACVRAMHALSAVDVPAGRHEVRLVYRPRSWRVGCLISLATFFAVILGGIWILAARRRSGDDQAGLRSNTTLANGPFRSTD